MLRFALDTDHLTLLENRHGPLLVRLIARPAGEVGISVVVAEEALRGRLARTARARTGPERILLYGRLLETIEQLHQLPLIPFDQSVEGQFQYLPALGLRIGAQDLKIAAIALANNLTLLTRNRRDFGRVPGLALDDCSV